MTDLKTLKDLTNVMVNRVRFDKSYEGDFYLSSCIPKEELKAEAVKWVKELRDNKDCDACKEADTYVTGKEEAGFVFEDVSGIISFLTYFFNLTEDDLKGGKKKKWTK